MGRHEYKWAYALEHALPSIKGLIRLLIANPVWALRLLSARFGFFFTRKLVRPIVTPDNFRIESGHQLVSYWSLFIERECWAADWIDALAKEDAPLIVDVGANAGLFTHLIWTKRADAEFVAFEPQPSMAGKISKWKAVTGANLVLYEKGVSDQCGSATFYASEEGDPTASLKPEGPKALQMTIPLVTLDSIIPSRSVFLMKVDVEGLECQVLAGGKETLQRTRFLIMEAHTQEHFERIAAQLGPGWRSKRVGASDFLFERVRV
jgi:FkbM family methyltransferase